MGRRTTGELITLIRNSLIHKPESITRIAEKNNIEWATANKILQILESLEFVSKTTEGRSIYYSLTNNNFNKKNWFGIPIIDKKDEDTINYLFEKIKLEWINKTGKEIGKTQINKTLAKINYVLNLNLPVGWYMYGLICLKIYDSNESYSFENIEKKDLIDQVIKDVVIDYSKFQTANELKLYQYNEFGNDLYISKEKILSLFSNWEFNKGFLEKIKLNLGIMKTHLPNIDQELLILFDEYFYNLTKFEKINKGGKINNYFSEIKVLINSVFNDLWGLIATYNFFQSLLDTQKYEKIFLQTYFKDDLKLKKIILNEGLFSLKEFLATKLTENKK